MKKELKKYISDNQLFRQNDKLLVAVSGGVDSVFLCHLLLLLGYDFSVVHCNFQLRGEESEQDALFVQTLAEQWKVPFYIKKFDTETYASDQKMSIQLAARELRYTWFEALRQSLDYTYILTAHHASDNIETVLYNFAKGTGLSGLTGINPKNNAIVRPLLWAKKEDILDYARSENLTYREDSSNFSDKYARNFIRHHIIPDFKNINPSFEQSAIENIQRLGEAKDLLDFFIQKIKIETTKMVDNQLFIDKNKLQQYPSVLTILFELLRPYGFNAAQIVQILRDNELKTGAIFYTHTHKLLIDRDSYILAEQHEEKKKRTCFTILEDTLLVEGTDFQLIVNHLKEKPDFPLTHSNMVFFDFDTLHFPLNLRKWQEGDRFQPLGMGGKSQLLSDFFRLKKLSAFGKDKVWVLETAVNQICWVVGLRMDERFKIRETSKSFLSIEFIKN